MWNYCSQYEISVFELLRDGVHFNVPVIHSHKGWGSASQTWYLVRAPSKLFLAFSFVLVTNQ